MSLNLWIARKGELDRRVATFTDRLLLVREDGTVVGHRGFTNDPVGKNLLTLLDVSPDEMRHFYAVLQGPENGYSLICTAGTSLPVLRTLFGATHLQLVLIPSGHVAAELAAPARLEAYLSHISFHDAARTHARPLSEQGVCAVTDWLLPYDRAFLLSSLRENTVNETARELERLIREISALCGCCVEYDLSALAHVTPDQVDFTFVKGVLLALFLAARRVAKDAFLSLDITESMVWGDTLYATLERADGTEGAIPELEPIAQAVRQSGAVFSCSVQPNAPTRVHVKAQLLRPRLEEQQMKEKGAMSLARPKRAEQPLPEGSCYPEITARAQCDLLRMQAEGKLPK